MIVQVIYIMASRKYWNCHLLVKHSNNIIYIKQARYQSIKASTPMQKHYDPGWIKTSTGREFLQSTLSVASLTFHYCSCKKRCTRQCKSLEAAIKMHCSMLLPGRMSMIWFINMNNCHSISHRFIEITIALHIYIHELIR